MNPLAKGIDDYLALRRGLGFKLVRHEAGLKEFASFLARKHRSHITVALALEWATQHAHQRPAEWAARLSVLRGFARHWSATDPLTEVPPLGLLPYRPARAQPYFYSDSEIRQLLEAAKARPSIDRCGAGPITVYSVYSLLRASGWVRRSTCALRIWTGPKECSSFVEPSSASRVWYLCMLPPARFWQITQSAGMVCSVAERKAPS